MPYLDSQSSARARRPAVLLVANFDSDVGYAWWLMESYWDALAQHYHRTHNVLLAYPTVSKIPPTISNAPLTTVAANFSETSISSVIKQCGLIRTQNVRCMYLSDQPFFHWRYGLFRLAGLNCIVVHDHTPGSRDKPIGFRKVAKTLLSRLSWLTADAAIATTPFVQKRHRDVTRVPTNKSHLVLNGLPPAIMPTSRPNTHETFRIPSDRRILITTGRAHPIKGIPFALSCVQRLVFERGFEDIHYLFCGDGPSLDAFRKLANELGISEYVTFAGRRSDVSDLLPGCYLALNPSSSEVGYSLAILEYMRAGIPTVVPDNPSVCGATVDGETGILYAENSVDSATDAIARLLEDPHLATTIGQRARSAVESQFSLSKGHESLVRVFESTYPATRRPQHFP